MRLIIFTSFALLFFSCEKSKVGLNTGWNAFYHIENGDTLSKIFIPNSFTPNGDGQNDIFNIISQNLDYTNFEFLIFISNGTTVFKSTQPEMGWDGHIKGIQAAAGLYSWKIHARDLYGHQYIATGNAYLVR